MTDESPVGWALRKPLVENHRQINAVAPGEPVHPGGILFAPHALLAGLLRSEPPQDKNENIISVADPPKIIHRHWGTIELGHKAVHLVLLAIDPGRRERRSKGAEDIRQK